MLAWLADGLTASRLALSVVIGAAIATDHVDIAILVLIVAWITDFFDGILARAAPTQTRLGEWDFRVDVSLGAAVFGGMAVAGRVPVWIVAVVAVLGVGWTRVTGNPAPAMLFLAVGYTWFLVMLLIDRPERWWLPFAALPILLVLDRRRFFRVIMPAFFRGLSSLATGETSKAAPVLDEWAG